jgi:hypothetical protein
MTESSRVTRLGRVCPACAHRSLSSKTAPPLHAHDPMLGTRARARAPEDHDPQPDETEPLAPISTLQLYYDVEYDYEGARVAF